MSGPGGPEGAPLLQACSPDASDPAPGQPDSYQRPKPREETEASQVMAESGEGSLGPVAVSRPQLPAEEEEEEEEGSSHDPAAGGRHGLGAAGAGLEQAPPPAGALKAESVSVATDRGLDDGGQPGGPQASGTCGAEKSGSEAEAADENAISGAGHEATVEKAGAEEEKGEQEMKEMEAQEKPVVGEEIEMAEEVEAAAGAAEEAAEAEAAEPAAEPEEGAGAGPRPLPVHALGVVPMNPLEAIQQELDTVNAQADRAFQQLEQKFGRMRRHYLERRNYIIQNIPGFWGTAFRNHPQLAPLIRGQDAEMLRYITNLEVKEFRHPKTGCKFKFFFRRNPFFRNKLIVKEYEVRAGRVVSLSTPIVWRRGHEPQSFIRRNQDVVCNFFTWFSDHSLPESDKIAEIIKEDLWPNPLQYYLLREGVRRARRRPIREPVEIPRPFGFQSG